MPSWLVWFLVAGNLLNMVFDATVATRCLLQWLSKRRYEKQRGVVRIPHPGWWARRKAARAAENEGRGRYPAGWP